MGTVTQNAACEHYEIEKGLMDMENSVVTVGTRAIRGLNGNGKITIKNKNKNFN